MTWLDGLRQRWAFRRRLDRAHRGLRICARDPMRIAEVARGLGISESEVRRLLQSLKTEPPAGNSRLRLVPRSVSPSETMTPSQQKPSESWRVLPQRAQAAGLGEQVRRLICVLLDLPIAQENPALARDFVAHITRASAYQNGHLIEFLGTAIADAQRTWLLERRLERTETGRVGEGRGEAEPALRAFRWQRTATEDVRGATYPSLLDARRSRLIEVRAPLRDWSARPSLLLKDDGAVESYLRLRVQAETPDQLKVVQLGSEGIQEPSETTTSSIFSVESPASHGTHEIFGLALGLISKTTTDLGALESQLREEGECILADVDAREASSASEITSPGESVLELEEEGEGGEPPEAGVPEDLPIPRGRDWQPVRALLRTVYGNPEVAALVEKTVDYLESLETAAEHGIGAACALEDVLIIVRTRLSEITLKLADRSDLTHELVETAFNILARHAAMPFRHLRWFLEQGIRMEGRTRGGTSLPPDVDVAWTLLARLALASLPHILKGPGPKIEWIRGQRPARPLRKESFLDALVAEPMAAVRMGAQALREWLEPTPPMEMMAAPDRGQTLWSAGVGWLLQTSYADVDPDLAVETAGELCRDQGTLTWEACLRLANCRARHHRFFDAGELPEQWDVTLQVQPQPDGSVAILFAVVQQPLSRRFRERFESEGLQGRIHILWHLVQFAKSFHSSVRSIGAADVQQQVALHEEELWERIGSLRKSSSQGNT